MDAYIGRHSAATIHDPYGLLEAAETDLAAKIFTKLWEHYPKRDWKVYVDIPGGIAAIKLPRLMHSALGFNFHLDLLAADPSMLIVVKGGGEILERLNLSRGRFSKAEMVDAIQRRVIKTKHDFAGQLAIDQHTTVTKPRLIVPSEYAGVSTDELRGRALARMALERAQAAARAVTPADLDDAARAIEAVGGAA